MGIFKVNNNKYFILFLTSIIFISFPQKIISQNTHNNSYELKLNKCINEYNITSIKLAELTLKLKKITLNFILKIFFTQLKTINQKIKLDITRMKEYINDTKYENIISEINKCDENFERFEEKYNKTIKVYNKFENTKNSIGKFFKIFFLTIFIVVMIFAVFVIIITFIIIKRQKKYYILKEEVTLEDGKEVTVKETVPRSDKRLKIFSDIRSEKDRILGSTLRNFNLRNIKRLIMKVPNKK